MAAKNIPVFAKTDFDCLTCGKTLKAGKRTPHQELCSTGRNSKTLSPCQIQYYKEKKLNRKKALLFIICDTCQKKIKQVDARQVRCMSGEKGVLSECQIIANEKAMKAFHKKKKEGKKACLKCGKKFPSKGDYNRICDSCSAVNDRVSRKEHKVGTCEAC